MEMDTKNEKIIVVTRDYGITTYVIEAISRMQEYESAFQVEKKITYGPQIKRGKGKIKKW